MPANRFYDIAGDEHHKALGLECYSPEEAQEYEKALTLDIPEGSRLIVRKRVMPKTGRIELIVGVAVIGQPLVLAGEEGGDPKANPPAPVQRALQMPEAVRFAGPADLEVMAQTNGVDVDSKDWQKANPTVRKAMVARAIADKKKAQPAGV